MRVIIGSIVFVLKVFVKMKSNIALEIETSICFIYRREGTHVKAFCLGPGLDLVLDPNQRKPCKHSTMFTSGLLNLSRLDLNRLDLTLRRDRGAYAPLDILSPGGTL